MAASIMKVWSFSASQGAQGKRVVWDGIDQPRGCRMCVSDGLWQILTGGCFFFLIFFHLGSKYLI